MARAYAEMFSPRFVGNSLRVSAGGSAKGGGMYTTKAVTQHHTVITGNHPDTCFGC